uniref:VQ domain-containing protein n=1 Tax=Physcomitrium patens TaxID=3218 RepID=A9TKP4_PHYPA|nr:hypothetical protein PHYPA_008626 [Physcomitrium patens]
MGAVEVQVNASKPSAYRSAGLQFTKTGGCAKLRVIHTKSPKVYKIQPEEFLELVQKLTGRSVPELPTTFQFIDTGSSKADHESDATSQHGSLATDFADSNDSLSSSSTHHRSRSFSSSEPVTLNFLPLLSTPRACTDTKNL